MPLASARAAALAVSPPVPPWIHREPARQLARQELSRSIYQPSVWQRIVHAVARWLNSVLGPLGPQHGGWWTLIVLIVVGVLVVFGVIAWIGPTRRSRRQRARAVLSGEQLGAEDHRRRSDRLAAVGDFAGAIVERVRAIAVQLESRGVLLPRPGRTASELAAEAASSLPASASDLRDAARLFDDVRYGGRAGTLAGFERVRDLDMTIASARTSAVAAGPGGSGAGTGGTPGLGGLAGPRA
jgi:type II secretory pathway pseudopilin PulG